MSFVEVEDILEMIEGFIKRLFKDVLDIDIPLPLPRMTYKEAMERYGSDKPYVGFGMEIVNLSDLVNYSQRRGRRSDQKRNRQADRNGARNRRKRSCVYKMDRRRSVMLFLQIYERGRA